MNSIVRYNIPELAKKYKVYAVDLLGFGWSEKALVQYDATIWMEQVSDFLREVVQSPSVVVGNRYLESRHHSSEFRNTQCSQQTSY